MTTGNVNPVRAAQALSKPSGCNRFSNMYCTRHTLDDLGEDGADGIEDAALEQQLDGPRGHGQNADLEHLPRRRHRRVRCGNRSGGSGKGLIRV